MKVILYLETNFILAMAKGQNGLADNILQKPAENLTIAIPSICLMESLVAWENQQKRNRSFIQAAQIEINEAQRNISSEEARSVTDFLQQSLISYENLLFELENRFDNVLETLNNRVELIEPKIKNLQSTLREPSLNKKSERRDDFILQCILDHASSNLEKTKAFFSENSKQFGQPVVRNALTERGIRYFSNKSNLEGWLQSLESE